MIGNYFKIAWRTLLRNKTYTFVNVTGLTLGITAVLLIFTLVSFHLSFDTFHPNSDRIYRVVTEWHDDNSSYSGAVPQPLGKAFRNDNTFAERSARIVSFRNTLISLPQQKEIKKFEEDKGVAFAEPAFFDIFNFPLTEGSYEALARPNSAVITQSVARKYFGDVPAIGKTIRFNNAVNFTITGILKDLPPNTDRKQEIYLSYDNLKDQDAWLASDSSWAATYTGSMFFVRLRPGVTAAQVDKAFPDFVKKYYTGVDANTWRFRLQPLADIHFNTNFDGYFNRAYIWALLLIGLFLLATACVNFINLATAQALNRAREVGVRKVLGSLRNQLFWQFIAETALITLLAAGLGYGLALLVLPSLNQLTMSHMSIRLFADWKLPSFLLLIFIFVVFLSGSYPGLVLARFQPVLALKNKLSQAHIGGFSLRRILVISQFAIAQFLIIAMIIMGYQMHYSINMDMGFNRESIVTVPVPDAGHLKITTLRERLAALPGVENSSLCMQPPASRRMKSTGLRYENRPEDEHWNVNIKPADDRYLSTFGLKLVAGRNFFPSDSATGYIVNETLVKKLNLNVPADIIGKQININGATLPVIGVIKDFHDFSLHSEINAVCLYQAMNEYRSCCVKIAPHQTRQTLAAIEKIWNNNWPDEYYSYTFLDERIQDFYFLDNILLTLVELFAGIAIFIGCLGLYGLVSFMAVRKTKEIGIRKVLGAGMLQIYWLFGKEFSRLILIAFLIAAPLAWWGTHAYLQDFKYRIRVGPVIFLSGVGFTFVIAALTVGYRSLRAARTNPIKSLRTE